MNTLSHLNVVVDYYDQTIWDYRLLWSDKLNQAVHFGYYSDGITNHSDALLNTNRILAELAEVQAGDHVLDAGCGRGGTTCWIATHKLAQVTGINPAAFQLQKARKLANNLGVKDRVQFMPLDFCNTGLPDSQFDAVIACESMCHAADKMDFYTEVYRLLKPGGHLIIADYVLTEKSTTHRDQSLLANWMEGWAMPSLHTKREHLEMSHRAGFSSTSIEDYTHLSFKSIRRLYRICLALLPIGSILRWLGLRSKVQHANHCGPISQFKALRKQLWYYGIIKATK